MTRPAVFIDRTVTDTTTAFGHTLRALRVRRRLSLGDLARATGMNVSSLSQLESGRAGCPRPNTVTKLATALDDTKHDLEYAALKTRYEDLQAELRVVVKQMEEYE
jgi:transcriptional regulator with XRE-family HTH domain